MLDNLLLMINHNKNKIEALLSIGITTKGRIDELRETLKLLENSELNVCNIILIDDGGCGDFISSNEYNLNLSICRFEASEGLVARRNQLADLCDTKYLMSLDDDSTPESGSVLEALDLMESNESIATIALNLYNNSTCHADPNSPNYYARYFVGCGHIHDVGVFKSLGGYTGGLIYGHEEREYALKLARASKKIIHVNNYVVKHRKSSINRVVGYNARTSRNLGWVNGTYLGLIPNLVEIYSFMKGKKRPVIIRCLRDYIEGLTGRGNTRKLSFSQYYHWKQTKTPTVA
jgi:glycosyltransferase involved in cell wall biosynthesis